MVSSESDFIRTNMHTTVTDNETLKYNIFGALIYAFHWAFFTYTYLIFLFDFFSHQNHMHFFFFIFRLRWARSQQINKMRKSKHTVFMKANLLILILTFLSKISPTRQNPQDTDSEQGEYWIMTTYMYAFWKLWSVY